MPVNNGTSTNVILKCSNDECAIYQILSNSKTLQSRKKWQCKVCQLKQSLKRFYAESDNAPQLRQQCQQMNLHRGQSQRAKEDSEYDAAAFVQQVENYDDCRDELKVPTMTRSEDCSVSTSSKWSCYLDQEDSQ